MVRYIGLGTRRFRAMRVIAGKYRGHPLRSLHGKDIRPTSDRLRETLFNVLTCGNPTALEGTVWLDLFAGTGSSGDRSAEPRSPASLFRRNLGSCHEGDRAEPAEPENRGWIQNSARRSGWDPVATAARTRHRRHCVSRSTLSDARCYERTLLALADSSLVWAMSLVIAEHEKKFDPGAESALCEESAN